MATITVSTAAQLTSALSKAGSGDTILLAAGDYGKLYLGTAFGNGFASPVTIAAADPGNTPEFSGLDLRGVSNLTFKGVTFDYAFQAGDPTFLRPFQVVSGSSDITFSDCRFDGDMAEDISATADGYGTGVGLFVDGVTNITVENSEISGFHRGLLVTNSNEVSITGNDVHSVRSDGMNFAAVQGVLIEGNRIHDFLRSSESGDHCDMIQFWTNGTNRPSTDIVIRDNVLDIGGGDATQSIFMRNEEVGNGNAGIEMFYRNVTIEGNVIVNGHANGIMVGQTAGLTITANSVLHADGGDADGTDALVEVPRISINASSTGVTITRNATSAISGPAGQAGWTVHTNAYVQDQDPLAPGWYGDVFVASSLDTSDGTHAFVARPGGMLDMLGAGAPATLTPGTGTGPLFHTTGSLFSGHPQTFDAGIMGPQPAGTAYLWNFGDGTTATGATVTHAFAAGGRYEVTLTLRSPDGQTATTTLVLPVASAEILRLDDSGAFAVYVGGEENLLAPVAGTDGLQLGAKGVITAAVARTHISPLLGTTEATVALTLSADAAGAAGEVMRLHNSMILSVGSAGEVIFQAWSSTGQEVTLRSTGVAVNDTRSHDIEMRLEGGRLELWVDGRLSAGTAFGGTFVNSGTHNLTFGNPWGRTNFNGDLEAFSIRLGDDADGAPQAGGGSVPRDTTQPAPAPALDAAFTVASTGPDAQTCVFDATPTLGSQPAGTTYLWTFGDGTTATGKTVTHTYEAGGDYQATLTVRLPDGRQNSQSLLVEVAGTDLVRLDDSGAFAVFPQGDEVLLARSAAATADGLQLGTKGIVASVARSHVAEMLDTDDVTVALTIDADRVGATGEILRLHDSFVLDVTRTGELQLRAWSSEGDAVRLVSTGLRVNSGAAHEVEIRLDGGRLGLWVDGKRTAEAAFDGTFADVGRHDLSFGNAWGRTNFRGDVSSFEITVDDGAGSQAFRDDPFTLQHSVDLSGPLM